MEARLNRLTNIDFVRGVVMIIMALDHVRDLIHVDAIAQSPTNLATTTPLLFFTRWITYFCAPVFVFLAGVSAFLSARNQDNLSKTKAGLVKRGLWLIVLDFTVLNFGLYFDIKFHTLLFEVLATIGFGFIVLAFLLKVSPRTIGILGLTIILAHNLFQVIPFAEDSFLRAIFSPLFNITFVPMRGDSVFLSVYPPIPWLGIMLCGFALGQTFIALQPLRRKQLFVRLGLACILFFVCLRFSNWYGDPSPWSQQKDDVFTMLSFLNVTKYPPSLLFCSLTLGGMFLLLAVSENMENRITKMVSVYGKVPLFYFLVHFYLIHLLLLVILFSQGFTWDDLSFASGTFGRPKDSTSGLTLTSIYLLWTGVVLILYFPCLWYGRFKVAHRYWWLKYL